VCSAMGDNGGGIDEEAALIELNDLLFQATELSKEQTLQELLELQQATAEPDGAADEAGEPSAGSSRGGSGRNQLLPVMLGHGSEIHFPGAVKALQRVLIARGYPCYGETGRFGRQTETALKAFQASEGLPKTGILDVATMELITQYDQ